LIIVLFLATIAVAGWLALPRIQALRADGYVQQANDEIDAANALLSDIDLSALGLDSFVSETSIQQTSATLHASLPALDDATGKVQLAIDSVDQASGLYRLPESYADYLEVKKEIAELRIEQLDTLKGAVEELQPLYDNGEVIFATIAEMDRIWGQVEYHIETLQNDPAEAAAGLRQAAASMRGLKEQIDSRNEASDFYLLESLSDSIEENAVLADVALELADAVAAGDQERVQQAAVAMDAQFMETTDTTSFVDKWVEYSVEPDVEELQELQEEQEELDLEAVQFFAKRI
jgi:hypothetical protein